MYYIWCYWSQGINNLPLFHNKCVLNFRKKLSSKFKINLIDKDIFLNMQSEISEEFLDRLTYQQQSDVIRLYLLYEYGGIWIDITSIILDDFNWVLDIFKKGYDQIGFYVNYKFTKNKSKELLENWFIAIKYPYNYKIFKWKEIFYKILKENIKEGGIQYSKTWNETKKDNYILDMGQKYLSMHVAHLWCLQNDLKYKELYHNNIYLFNAYDTALSNIFDPFTLIYGIGYNFNFNFHFIKLTGTQFKLLNYFCSKRLKKIIKDELDLDYTILKIPKLILFILIIIFIIFKYVKLNKPKKNYNKLIKLR